MNYKEDDGEHGVELNNSGIERSIGSDDGGEDENFSYHFFSNLLSSENYSIFEKIEYFLEFTQHGALANEHVKFLIDIDFLQIVLSHEFALDGGEILLFLKCLNNLFILPYGIIGIYLEKIPEVIISIIEIINQIVQVVDIKSEEFEYIIKICQYFFEEPYLQEKDQLKALASEVLNKMRDSNEFELYFQFIKDSLISNFFLEALNKKNDLLIQLIHQDTYNEETLILYCDLLKGLNSYVIQSNENKLVFLDKIGINFLMETKINILSIDCVSLLIDLISEIFYIPDERHIDLNVKQNSPGQPQTAIQFYPFNEYITNDWLNKLKVFYSDIVTVVYLRKPIDREINTNILENCHSIIQKITELFCMLSERNIAQIIFSNKIIKLLYYIYKNGKYEEKKTVVRAVKYILSEPESANVSFRYFFNHKFLDFLLDILGFDGDCNEEVSLLDYVPNNRLGISAYDIIFLMHSFLNDRGFGLKSGFYRRINNIIYPKEALEREEEIDEDDGAFDEAHLDEE